MLALQITELKPFMNKLFLGDVFDTFLLSEASFVTFNTFHIDGKLKKEFYSATELEEHFPDQQSYSTWKQVRPFCLELIKGKHTPLEFKIVLRLSERNLQKLLDNSGLSLSIADINGLFLNLHYHDQKMLCSTGTAMNLFTLDKSLDQLWADMIMKYLTKNEISFETL